MCICVERKFMMLLYVEWKRKENSPGGKVEISTSIQRRIDVDFSKLFDLTVEISTSIRIESTSKFRLRFSTSNRRRNCPLRNILKVENIDILPISTTLCHHIVIDG